MEAAGKRRPEHHTFPSPTNISCCRRIPGGGGGGTGGVAAVEKLAAVADGVRSPTMEEQTSCSTSIASSSSYSSSSPPPFGLPECQSERSGEVARAVLPEPALDPIWDAIRDEAKHEADKEPILSSFLYSSILSHDCLERALGFVLANRLQDPTLLATQLMDIFDDVMMQDRSIQDSLRLDLQAFKDRDPACVSYSCALLYFKGFHSLESYRVAHALWNQDRKILALALQSRISEVFAVDIHPGRLLLPYK
ncbi:hypothetical protein Taro_051831 [Colocasia esculenta]|uniref:Serine acetyltransferase N-terminal domain-containing protein n=1 Tax=Colocasia esculenta TaxID=4460 RepID=A0A843XGZ7_COLES|nr:hypothetical protein [Colocasia esculenta]